MTTNEITEAIIGRRYRGASRAGAGVAGIGLPAVPVPRTSAFEDYLSYVSNPCRLFTKVSDWIVGIAWT